jgi:hypothetical protein
MAAVAAAVEVVAVGNITRINTGEGEDEDDPVVVTVVVTVTATAVVVLVVDSPIDFQQEVDRTMICKVCSNVSTANRIQRTMIWILI